MNKRSVILLIILLLVFTSGCVKKTGQVIGIENLTTTYTETTLSTTTSTMDTTSIMYTPTLTTSTTTLISTTTISSTATSTSTTTTILLSNLAMITKVIDGDTIEISTGERVRLLGINAPEKGQKCYEEATQKLKELVESKGVLLEKDVDDKDQYGRLLRYVWFNGELINLILVKQGLANVYILEPNTKYEEELREAENYAKENKIGCLWEESEKTCKDCIGVYYFHYDARGNDCENLNDEYVIFKNTCDFDCELTNWRVKDEANHIYIFPEFTLKAQATVTLYTGCGENTENELYWCNSGYKCNAIWNNKGDTLYLWDDEGNLVLTYSY